MQTKIPSTTKPYIYPVLGLLVLLVTSCSSYRHTTSTNGTNTDGTEVTSSSENKSSYYKQYFKSKSTTYENIPEEDIIFTDIEAYSTSESLDEDGNIVIEERSYESDEGYKGWGDNEKDITINVYNDGFYGGWNRPWRGYWGWNNWGWNNWGWGHSYWGWNIGFNWGWGGFYNPWYCSPYWYGGGFYRPIYYRPYYGYNGYAYAHNRGRSNRDYLASRYNNRGRSNATRGNYSRAESARRIRAGESSRPSVNRGRPSTRPSVSRGRPTNTRPSIDRGRPETARPRPNINRGRPEVSRPSRPSRPSYSRPSSRPSRPSMSRPSSRRSSGSFRGGSSRRGRG